MAEEIEALHRRIAELTEEIRQLRRQFTLAMGSAETTRRVPRQISDDRQPPPVKGASKKR